MSLYDKCTQYIPPFFGALVFIPFYVNRWNCNVDDSYLWYLKMFLSYVTSDKEGNDDIFNKIYRSYVELFVVFVENG